MKNKEHNIINNEKHDIAITVETSELKIWSFQRSSSQHIQPPIFNYVSRDF